MSEESYYINHIEEELKRRNISIFTIFDLGANDLEESLYLSTKFPEAIVYAIEANPRMKYICENKVTDKIKFHSCGIGLKNEHSDFYVADDGKQSSSYKFTDEHYNRIIGNEVKEIITANIEYRRLDSFDVTPDLIFMDIQGGEYNALLSLGDNLDNVKVIASELMTWNMYQDAPSFDEVDNLLNRTFELVYGNPFTNTFDNFIYIRKDLLNV